ncbi:MAG: phosphate acyltransferase [Thermodesulfobacteriota bacterium]|nr:phosphate acyltransferase [Thermodesulfobacteriota bacterium]
MNNPSFKNIIKAAKTGKTRSMVITGDGNNAAVNAVFRAQDIKLIEPVFCGQGFSDLDRKNNLLSTDSDTVNARKHALGMVRSGEADILLDTEMITTEFLQMLSKVNLINGHTLSYVSVFESVKEQRLTLLTDTLINSTPNLKEKTAILENAIPIADVIGIKHPNIAALAPLELVNPAIKSTMDAAILSKMSQRGQFGNAVIEGPLAMDNAESADAAIQKGIQSTVPGNADIYFFPDIESANLTAQFLAWVFRVKFAGVLAGTKVPIVVHSPLENDDSWLLSIALAVLSC